MAVGALAPLIRYVVMGTDGQPSAGAKAYFYLSGTSTPQNVYSDAALTTPRSNPVEADADGVLPPIYFAAVNYRVLITDANGVTIYPATDNVFDFAQLQLAPYRDNGVCDGRLTLTSGTPVTVNDVTAATTVYFAPYKGNRIALYADSAWSVYTFSQLSIALGSDTANLMYDVFAYVSGGAVAIERLAWSSATARATNLTTQDGVLVKSGDATRRYLGSYYTTASGQTEDSYAKRLVWNYTHRPRRAMRVVEGTNSWTYTTPTFRQANGSTANQIAVAVGWAEVAIHVEVAAIASNNNASPPAVVVGIGEDSTTTVATACIGRFHTPLASSLGSTQVRASLDTFPAVGYHFYTWLEYSGNTGTTTWTGDDGGPTLAQSGIYGWIDG
jgi:hypothetical protein